LATGAEHTALNPIKINQQIEMKIMEKQLSEYKDARNLHLPQKLINSIIK